MIGRARAVLQPLLLLAAVPAVVTPLAGSPPPIGVYAIGVIVGALYGLLAIGLILVYQATRVINFAGPQLGSASATLALILMAQRGLPYPAAIVLAVGGGLAVGAFTERLLLSRFRTAPRLIFTVATIGLAQLLAFVEFYIPQVVGGSALAPTSFPTPLQSLSFRLGVVTFTADHVVAVIAAAAAMIALTRFLSRSRSGVAIRACAENVDRAALLGIPIRRVSTLVWAVAAAISALGVFLRAPLIGLPAGGFTSPSLLLYALAAAVVARMRSMPLALVAGMAIGMLEQSVVFTTRRSSLAYGAMLVVILGALLAQRRELSRAFENPSGSYQTIAPHRPLPPELRHLPTVVWGRRLLLGLLLLAALVAPYLVGNDQLGLLTLVVITTILGISLVVLTGWAAQISLGHFGIAGVGALAAGSVAAHHNADLFVSLGAGVLAAVVASVLIGIPALRLQGLMLAVSTLAFAFAVQFILLNPEYAGSLLPGAEGRYIERPVLYGMFDLRSDRSYYYFVLVMAALCWGSAAAVRRYRTGRVLIASRDNERSAQAFGITVAWSRLAAFVISGAYAGLAGGLLAFQQRSVDDQTFNPAASIALFTMSVVGGLGSVLGAMLGALYFRGIPYLLESRIEGIGVLSTGVGLLVVLHVAPGGFAELVMRLRDRGLRVIAARHGLEVPSLNRDRRDAEPAEAKVQPAASMLAPSDIDGEVVLRCSGVEVDYGPVQVLFGVDLEIRRGERLALLGTNGAGKSTLLRAISGLADETRGSITFEGIELVGRSPGEIAGLGIVQMPGGRAIFPTLTVAEHFTCAAWLRDDVDEVAADTTRALDLFPRLRERWDGLAGNLSGGEQQMLALGMALISRPKVLLIDELSLGLAPSVVAELLGVVRTLSERDIAVVLVEQSLNVALTACDRAYFLEKGEVRFEGATADLMHREDLARSVFIQPTAPPGAVDAAPSPPRRDDPDGRADPYPLVLERVSKRFGGVLAVDDVSLAIEPGEAVAFIGPNGAGKTSLFDLISGHTRPDEGRILLDGNDVTGWSAPSRSAFGMGRSMQDARLFGSLTVAENLALGFERHLPLRDHLASALALPAVQLIERDVAYSVGDLVDLMHLGAYRNKLVGELSTGTRRIVDLAMCLAHNPSVLLLDEPSSGVAQRETEALASMLDDVRIEIGCTLLIIDHDMPLLSAVCGRMVALVLGHPIADGDVASVLADPAVLAAYLGDDEATIFRSGNGARPVSRPEPTGVR